MFIQTIKGVIRDIKFQNSKEVSVQFRTDTSFEFGMVIL